MADSFNPTLFLQRWRILASLIPTMGIFAHNVTKFQTSPRRGFVFSGSLQRKPKVTFLFLAARTPIGLYFSEHHQRWL